MARQDDDFSPDKSINLQKDEQGSFFRSETCSSEMDGGIYTDPCDPNIYQENYTLYEFEEPRYGIGYSKGLLTESLYIKHGNEGEDLEALDESTRSLRCTLKSLADKHFDADTSSRQIIDYVAEKNIGHISDLATWTARKSTYHEDTVSLALKEQHKPLPSVGLLSSQDTLSLADSPINDFMQSGYKDRSAPLIQRQLTLGANISYQELYLKHLATDEKMIIFIIQPNELGRIRVDISHDKKISIRVKADRTITKELLQEHIDLFLSELYLDGISDADIFFEDSDEGGEQISNRHSQSHLVPFIPFKDSESENINNVRTRHVSLLPNSLSLRL